MEQPTVVVVTPTAETPPDESSETTSEATAETLRLAEAAGAATATAQAAATDAMIAQGRATAAEAETTALRSEVSALRTEVEALTARVAAMEADDESEDDGDVVLVEPVPAQPVAETPQRGPGFLAKMLL